ncbi:MAG: acyltransferase family protein, partial [Acidimicrobiales bacterium]
MEGVSVAAAGAASSEDRGPVTADPLGTEVNLESIAVEVPPVTGAHRYLPALDGLRALAVAGVVSYHFGLHWADGGYLGVDFFFVLSGFLITGLLVGEWNQRSTIGLRSFWFRRAKRLLPAVMLLLLVLSLYARLGGPNIDASTFGGDALATLFYYANWHLIFTHQSYFAQFLIPSPLRHTWSLAIEEQFYLVLPLVVQLVLHGRRRRRQDPSTPPVDVVPTDRRRRLEILVTVAGCGAVASAVWMAVLSPLGTVSNRAYYGTDTRAQGLLVGAALAAAFARWGTTPSARARQWFGTVAIAGGLVTLVMWVLVPETSVLAFHGGFLVVALATAAVVAAAVTAPKSVVPRLLGLRPLRALGRISYGVYLWYWPVLLVMNGARTGLSGFDLFVARVAVTAAIAAVSYRFVEQPIRRGALPSWRAAVAVPVGAGVAVVAMAVATLAPVSA